MESVYIAGVILFSIIALAFCFGYRIERNCLEVKSENERIRLKNEILKGKIEVD